MAINRNNPDKTPYPELAAALKDVKHYFIYAGLFSAAINLLMLAPIIYMLQVYSRVVARQPVDSGDAHPVDGVCPDGCWWIRVGTHDDPGECQ